MLELNSRISDLSTGNLRKGQVVDARLDPSSDQQGARSESEWLLLARTIHPVRDSDRLDRAEKTRRIKSDSYYYYPPESAFST